jgi:MoaA/NifB/PqqE/SkfB family radical SAM enzyme
MMHVPNPTETIISVTNRCDARCTMCNIWRLNYDELLRPEDYRRSVPSGLRDVNITGGEALLRRDIEEVVEAIYESSGKARIIIATNGFRTKRTLATLERIASRVPRLGVGVSLDGDEATHDRMRGVHGAYRRAIATIRSLHSVGVSDVRIGFTATPENIHQLNMVYELSRELGVEFAATIAQNSQIYYSTGANQRICPSVVQQHFGALIGRRLAGPSIKEWIRGHFDNGVIHFAENGERQLPCTAGSDFFFIAPNGDLYPCLTIPTAIGNLRERSFADLWCSEEAQQIRRQVSGCRQCWMVCTARAQIARHPVAVGSWVMRQQTKALQARIRLRLSRAS